MTAEELLRDFSAQGVELWAEGRRLRYRAPRGALTADRLERLRHHKDDLLTLLADRPFGGAASCPTDGTPGTAAQSAVGTLPDAGTEVVLPLSYGQQALWFLHCSAPESPAYNVAFTARILSGVDVPTLQRTFAAITARHPSLRTTFRTREQQPVQVVHARRDVFFEQIDASGWEWEELKNRVEESYRRPFDLRGGPVIRVSLFTRSPEDHVLLVAIHHIVCDGWSLWILQHEFRLLYPGEISGEPAALRRPSSSYADFIRWQSELVAGPDGERMGQYWQKQLSGELPVLNLPTDKPRPGVQRFRGASLPLQIDEELTGKLKELAQNDGATLYMVLLAAFQVLLYRYTHQDDVLVGSPTAGRSQAEFTGLVGYFVNPIVLRGDLSGNPTFRQFLGRVRRTVLEALTHEGYPFPLLVERLRPKRDAGRSPVFQTLFALQRPQMLAEVVDLLTPGQSEVRVDWGGLQLEPFEMPQEEGQFELSLEMVETAHTLLGVLKYCTDLFERATAQRMLVHLQNLLLAVVEDPDRPISQLPMLSPAERHELLVARNDTASDYPRDASIGELFQAQARQTPRAVALAFQDRELTYEELNRRANQLAHHLRGLGVGPDSLVGICMERSLEMVVALLGTLKAGGAYLPLDADYPPKRLQFMLEDSRCAVVLAGQPPMRSGNLLSHRWEADVLRGHGGTIVRLDDDRETIEQRPTHDPPWEVGAENLAYVMYTSGSTGVPKAAEIVHRSVVRLVRNTNYLEVSPQDVFLQFAPLSFDASTLEIWAPLLGGARLEIFPPGLPSLEELGRFIREKRVTILWLTAGLFCQQVDYSIADLAGVRQLLAGGDVVSPAHALRVLCELKDCCLINGYGPTENTTFTCCHRMTAPQDVGNPVSIGKPIANTRVYVLDEHLGPVPAGVPGELYTSGDGLGRGYRGRPELTAERFVPDPFSDEPSARMYRTGDLVRWLPDGTLEFLGRRDHQVKVRGFRIELGEIESALVEHRAVNGAVVISQDEEHAQKRLVAYTVADRQVPPSVEELRRFLKERLPDYMVPSVFVALDAFPLTPNGKVDRGSLPEPDRSRPKLQSEYVAPRNDTERLLAKVWSEVLGIDKVGIHDNFFELGGASLTSLRVIAKAEEAGLSVNQELLTPELLFESPTIAEVAALFEERKQLSTATEDA